MARPGYIDGVDDMLADAERLDAEQTDELNQVQVDMIEMLFRDLDFSVEDIAGHLAIEADDVQEILRARGIPQDIPVESFVLLLVIFVVVVL